MTLARIHAALAMALGLVACGPKADGVDEGADAGSSESTVTPTEESSTATSVGESTVTSAADGSDTTGTVETGTVETHCPGAVPILQTLANGESAPTGLEQCADGSIHRFAEVPCEGDGGCRVDGDCSERQVCLCEAASLTSYTHCVDAECRTSSECGDQLCGLYRYNDGCGDRFGLGCFTANDECVSNADCDQPELACVPFDTAERQWTCASVYFCPEGRPFVVAGEARVAPLCKRDDWSTATRPDADTLGHEVRRELAARWAEKAAAEHASIASFARFILQLVSLGAPAWLVEAAQTALADETDHARRAYALASAYAGEGVGPGPLDVSGALPIDREAIVMALIEEACIGETMAAVEAAIALEHARDPVVADTLAVIARDELRHAELGWQTLQWMLGEVEPGVQGRWLAVLEDAIDRMGARLGPVHLHPERETLARHGILDAAGQRVAMLRALDEVIRPLARDLTRAPVRLVA